MKISIRRDGFTLVELILSIALIAVIAASTAYYATGSVEAKRYEDTRVKMELIYKAIIGDNAVNNEGNRINFGYHGDMGKIPATLGALSTVGAQAAWAYDSTYGMGAGWRGPYIHSPFTGANDFSTDEWGHAFIYSTGASPPSLTSYGSDNASGGVVYAKDLVVELPTYVRLATVQGILLDSNSVVKSKTVRIAYPSNGAITTADATSDATTGTYTFSNIPFGVRALRVPSTTETLGYKPFTVDSSQYYVSNGFINFASDLQKVTGSGSVTTGNANAVNGSRIKYAVDSSYETDLTLNYITCWWDGSDTAYLKTVKIDNTTESVTNCLNSGQRSNLMSTLILDKNSTGSNFYLDFTTNDCNTGKAISTGVVITCKLEWDLAASNPDTITMTVP